MAARVYECGRSEMDALKKYISYDPYLDPNVIPPQAPGADKPEGKRTEEEKKAIEEREQKLQDAMSRLREDKYHDVIFARQDCRIVEGAAVGLSGDTVFLYVRASEEFLEKADAALAAKFKTVRRASSEDEKRVIDKLNEEEESANSGFGAIFG